MKDKIAKAIQAKDANRSIWIIRLTILFLGAAFIGLGIFRAEVFTVLTKAIRICLECIGLG